MTFLHNSSENSDVPRQFRIQKTVTFRKEVTFTVLTNYFSKENLLTMKWIILYKLYDNKVRANNGMKVKGNVIFGN